MTHKDFVLDVQKSCHIDHQHCTMLLNALCKLMAQAGVEQVPVTLAGLGTFTSRKHPEYIQEDPQTGRQTLYPPRISYRMQTEEHATAEGLLEKQLAEHTRTDIEMTSKFVASLVQTIVGALSHGEEVEVKGLGTFRNVVTHQGELQRVAYMPDDLMRNLVNAPFNCFEPVVIENHPASVLEPLAEGSAAPSSEEPESAAPALAVEAAADSPCDKVAASADVPCTEEGAPACAEEVAASADAPCAEEGDPASADEVAASTDAPSAEEEPEIATAETSVIPMDANNELEQITQSNTDKTSNPMNNDPQKDYEDDDDFLFSAQNLSRTNHKLIYTLGVLIALACVAMIAFILNIDKEDSSRDFTASNSYTSDEPYVQPNPELDIPEEGEEQTAETLAPEESVAEEPHTVEPTPTAAEPKAAETTKNAQQEKTAESAKTEPAAPEKNAEKPKENKTTAPASARLKNPDGSYATHKLVAGDRLTILALKYYGEKSFWPYIFEVNKDKLKSPSLIQTGVTIYLPDPAYFGIDANDPESIRKAKNAAAPLLKL